MKKIIKGYNQKMLRGKSASKTETCTYRKSKNSPLNGHCLTDNAVYRAELEIDQLER